MSRFKLSFDAERHHYAFGTHDRILIRGVAYTVAPYGRSEQGWLFEVADGSGRSQSIPHHELSRLGSMGHIRVERDHYLPMGMKRWDLIGSAALLCELSPAQRARVSKKFAYVQSYLELKEEKLLVTTDRGIMARHDLIRSRAMGYVETLRGGQGVPQSQDLNKTPSPRTLRRWTRQYLAHGMSGLIDSMDRRGNRNRLMDPEQQALMAREVALYANYKRPTIKIIHENVCIAFAALNEERAAQGQFPFPFPSYETVRRAVRMLNPYTVVAARYGVEAARKKFMPVGQGLRLTRPLERVEFDETIIDIMSVAIATGLCDLLLDEEKARCGLDKTKARWVITLALCATTRCVLGMVLSRTPKEEAALQVLQMVLSDKGRWADATDSNDPWDMHGTPVSIVTDNGAAFKSERFRAACADLQIIATRAPAGFPELRARNERFFGSLNTGLLPRLPGRTFSSIREKGDANPEASAVLTFDDLAFCLIRWIVDIYHKTPHAGLGGETPLNCWRRLTAEWGVQPPPEQSVRRAIFGQRLIRRLSKEGVAVLGVHYHSEELARYMMSRNARDVEVRWHPDDIGTVTIYIEGGQLQVGATFPGFEGVSAQQWLAARRQLQGVNPERKAYDITTIQVAIRAIEARGSAAVALAGLLVEDWTPERIKWEENRLFIGFHVAPDKQPPSLAADGIGRSVLNPETGKLPPAAPASRSSSHDLPSGQLGGTSAESAAERPADLSSKDPWKIVE